MTIAAPPLKDTFTSTGQKFFAHEEAMRRLQNGQGQPIVTHVMATDVCNHKCAFCSVQTRAGDTLKLSEIEGYLSILLRYGLKAVILSGGGNPILYRCPETKQGFDELVDIVSGMGLEIGLITNGAAMKAYPGGRWSWKMVAPETLDKLTWMRISMAGLDHAEREVYVPDIDSSKTTLGFSYVFHDIYTCPEDKFHGKVSTESDLIQIAELRERDIPGRKISGMERLPWLQEQIGAYVRQYHPRYVRLLPNCLEPHLIAERCDVLRGVAEAIDPQVVFVQYKPPAPPHVCYLGYVHPVLNSDGYVYPCDSCVLNESANHKFANPWRICHWTEIAQIYETPVRSLIKQPGELCRGCVFTESNRLLEGVRNGEIEPTPPEGKIEHQNFI